MITIEDLIKKIERVDALIYVCLETIRKGGNFNRNNEWKESNPELGLKWMKKLKQIEFNILNQYRKDVCENFVEYLKNKGYEMKDSNSFIRTYEGILHDYESNLCYDQKEDKK